MKEQPPLSVLLAAGIAIALGGALFAETSVASGKFVFSFGAVFAVSLGFGLLRGFEIARAWLMILSGFAGLAGILTFVFGSGMLLVSAHDGPVSFAEIMDSLPWLVLGIGAFWGSRHPATRSWCKAEISLNTMSALKMAVVFLLAGVAVTITYHKQIDTVYPVFCTVKFRTDSKVPPEGYIIYRGTESFEGATPPKISVGISQDNQAHQFATLEGVAYAPFQVGFSMTGFKKCDYTISNGSPREVTLTLVSDKLPERAER